MTKREKVADIIRTMISEGLVDPIRMVVDPDYCINMVAQYIEAANIAREMMHMEPLDLNSYPD